MRAAYISQYDARSVESWSGTGFNMAKCLSDAGIDLMLVGPLKFSHPVRIAPLLSFARRHHSGLRAWRYGLVVSGR
jgi:hypothetical protein